MPAPDRGGARFRGRAAALAFAASLGIACAAWAAPPPAPPPPGLPAFVVRHLDAMRTVDSLQRAARFEEAVARLGPLRAAARAAGDRAATGFLLRVEGQLRVMQGAPRLAEAPLREAVAIARATRDSALLARGLTWLMSAVADQGRHDEAGRVALELLAVGIARGSPGAQGAARLRLAQVRLVRGEARAAMDGYREAARLLDLAREPALQLDAWTGLGNAHAAAGEADSARVWYARVADSARVRGDAWNEAHAENNLGTLEFLAGDPAQALRHFERARDLHLGRGLLSAAAVPAVNVAIALKHLGRWSEARSALAGIAERCERGGVPAARPRIQLAGIAQLAGRPAEAAAILRGVLREPGRVSVAERVDATLGLARALASLDSVAAAVRLLDDDARALGDRVPADRVVPLALQRGELALAAGDATVALGHLARAEAAADAAGDALDLARALAGEARADLALGEPARARAWLERAAAAWERARAASADPEWRAARGETGRHVYGLLARVLIEHPADGRSGAAGAFDALQRFKARTLHERTLGPRAGPDDAPGPPAFRPVALRELQDGVLREGELLLDAFVGEREAYLFAVTRDRCEVVRLPSGDSLEVLAGRVRRVLGTPPAAGAALTGRQWRRVGAAFGTVLFAGVEDLVLASRRIAFSGDGVLHRVPFGALAIAAPGEEPQPLAATHEIQVVPSATFLAGRRAAGGGPVPEPFSALAVAGLRDARGRVLAGARREVRTLGRRYRDVEVRLPERDATAPEAAALEGFGLLHFASHTTVDDERPWRSSVVLGGADDRELRASEIARHPLAARLAVLSGCESAGTRESSGEGLQGLGAAFLCAGVPAVVATLWPVDDAATERFMDAFYRALARGAGVAAALGVARGELAGTRRFAHPFYWAGFVLQGDADVRVPLRSRRLPAAVGWLGGVAVAVAAAAAAGRRARAGAAGGV